MKIDLEVVHTCTIKRKKPWPKLTWIGKVLANFVVVFIVPFDLLLKFLFKFRINKQIFMFDNQRVSVLDPKNGKTKRKINKITNLFKNIVAMNLSDSKILMVGIQNTGDLFVWNKDTEVLKTVQGMKDFAYKLGSHCPSVYISDDASKILLVTSRNKVFLYETDTASSLATGFEMCGGLFNSSNQKNVIAGNWSTIVAPQDIKTVEDNKELSRNARFIIDKYNGTTAICTFVFNYENQMTVTILRIKWINTGEIVSLGQSRFETLWTTYQPQLARNNICPNFECINSRGAYVCRLSYSTNILAVAINQKYVVRNCLIFISPLNGCVFQSNLRHFGLSDDAKGRHYWIQDLNWVFNDLYLAGITKHGSVFLVSRLGNPLLVHAVGREFDMGPALYITLHPLIIVRAKNDANNVTANSINSVMENEDAMRQRYSISCHPVLPIILCSDGYLVCVLSVKAAYINESRLLRELMYETTRLANSLIPKRFKQIKYTRKSTRSSGRAVGDSRKFNIPDWGLHTSTVAGSQNGAGESSFEDSGVENDGAKPLVAEGKIIFSYIPQILPISFEKLETNTHASKVEALFELLQNSWNMLATASSMYNKNDSQRSINIIQQILAHFTYLFLSMDYENLKQTTAYKTSRLFTRIEEEDHNKERLIEEFKLKIVVTSYLNIIKALFFDVAESHLFIYLPETICKIVTSILKYETVFAHIDRYSLLKVVYTFLELIESTVKRIYELKQNEQSFVISDVINKQKLFAVELTNKMLIININQIDDIDLTKDTESESTISEHEKGTFNYSPLNYCMEKSWKSLLHYTHKYYDGLLFSKKYKDMEINYLDLLICLIERHLTNCENIHPIERSRLYKVNKGDELYYSGNLTAAVNQWRQELNGLLNQNTRKSYFKCRKLTHKILYANLAHYDLKNIVLFLNDYLINYLIDDSKDDSVIVESDSTRVNLKLNTFLKLQPPKPLFIGHPSIICALQSFARFMGYYFMNKTPLFIYTTNNPQMMPDLVETCEHYIKYKTTKKTGEVFTEIHHQKLTNTLKNKKGLQKLISIDKTLELLIITGLYEEAIYFAYTVNDWKSAFFLYSILKESDHFMKNYSRRKDFLPPQVQPENILTSKICSLLDLEKASEKIRSNKTVHLLDNTQVDQLNQTLKDLILCSVITKINVVSPLLKSLLETLVSVVNQSTALVANDFYLPAPPIYCAQMLTPEQFDEESGGRYECTVRSKLYNLTKCIIQLLVSSNLYVPLIKWYLQELNNASLQMKSTYGIVNQFTLNNSLIDLLKSIRFQKIGYIPEDLLFMFRDFCAIIFYLDARDKFSILIRKSNSSLFSNSNQLNQIWLEIIEYGNLILSFRGFLKEYHEEVQDLILSAISRLSTTNQILALNLETKLASCVGKSPLVVNKTKEANIELVLQENSENFQSKLNTLLERWSQIRVQFGASLTEVYNEYLNAKRSTTMNLVNTFGLSEDVLMKIYLQKLPRQQPFLVGSYDFERSYLSTDFLELFFKIGFNSSNSWETFVQSVNSTPLLPEFYEIIRSQELPNEPIDKSYILTPSLLSMKHSSNRYQLSSHRSDKDEISSVAEDANKRHATYRGLFRTYSIRPKLIDSKKRSSSLQDLRHTTSRLSKKGGTNSPTKLRKSVSFSNLKNTKTNNFDVFDITELIPHKNDTSIVEVVSLANSSDIEDDEEISEQLNALTTYKVLDYGPNYIQVTHLAMWLIKWSKRFNSITDESVTAFKLNTINANMLVGCVYLANNFDQISSIQQIRRKRVKHPIKKRTTQSPRKTPKTEDLDSYNLSDDFTEITQTFQQQLAKSKLDKSDNVDTSRQKDSARTFPFEQSAEVKKQETEKHSTDSETLNISSLEDQELQARTDRQPADSHRRTPSPTKTPTTKRYSGRDEYSVFTEVSDIKNEIQREQQTVSKTPSEGLGSYFQSSPSLQFDQPIYPSTSQFSMLESIQQSQLVQSQQFQQQQQMLLSQQFQQQSGSLTQTPSNINEIIKDELKKIIQLQHDTVMTFLNGGSSSNFGMPVGNGFINQNSQLNSVVQSNVLNNLQYATINNGSGQPMEFIIETKVKTANNVPINAAYAELLQMQRTNVNTKRPDFMEYSQSFNQVDFQKSSVSPQRLQSKQFQEEDGFKSQQPAPGHTSNMIKIPLLNVRQKQSSPERKHAIKPAWPSKDYVDSGQERVGDWASRFPLLNIGGGGRRERHEVSVFGSKIPTSLPVQTQREEAQPNKYLSEFISISKSYFSTNQKMPLLQLNYKPPEPEQRPLLEPQVKQRQDDRKNEVDLVPIREVEVTTKTPVATETKAVEAMKPLYDGYMIKPGSYDEMLGKEETTAQVTSAELHYKSTQHLRDRPQRKPHQKDMCIMTDNLTTTNVPAPDILFKLKFDPTRKGREASETNDLEMKDFVNVVDLDSGAVEDILKLIQYEQDKRAKKQLTPKDTAKQIAKRIVDESVIKEEDEKEEDSIEDVPPVRPDLLTENLFKDKEKPVNYDILSENLLSSYVRTTSKVTIIDEFKSMDQKIKAINEMASDMSSDYNKYTKVIEALQERDKYLPIETPISSERKLKEDEKRKQQRLEKEKERIKPHVYTRSDALEKIKDLKDTVERPVLIDESKIKTPRKRSSEIDDLLQDDELSDLKDEEELKLQKILTGDSISLTNILQDVFEDRTETPLPSGRKTPLTPKVKTPVQTPKVVPKPRVKSTSPAKKQAAESAARQQKHKERMESIKKKRDVAAQDSSKSPVRRKPSPKAATQPSPRLNITYKVPTSTLVKMEKEQAERRENLQDYFSQARENEAKQLMLDIFHDTAKLHSKQSENIDVSIEYKPRVEKTIEKPTLETSPIKGDLMTKTLRKLQKEEEMKRLQNSLLIQEFQERALYDDNMSKQPKSTDTNQPIKRIKSFTQMVHLQDPDKLKHIPQSQPMTYVDQLRMHQEPTITKPSGNEIYKIFGTKRVPGLYKPYVKEAPRKVKTYSERVRDLRPNQSAFIIDKRQPSKIPVRIPKKRTPLDIRKSKTYAEQLQQLQPKHQVITSSKPYKKPTTFTVQNKKHPLSTKDRVEYRKEANRYTPYTSPYVEGEMPDEISPWSVDDNIKQILYDVKPQTNTKKRVTYRDMDQDTLADTDDYLYMLDADQPSQAAIQNMIREFDDDNNDDLDYTDNVNVDDLKNIVSLSMDSVTSSFIDWDQVDKLIADV